MEPGRTYTARPVVDGRAAGCSADPTSGGVSITSAPSGVAPKVRSPLSVVPPGAPGDASPRPLGRRSDGFAVRGSRGLRGGTIDARGDHRLAMLGAIAGLASREGVEVTGFDAVAVSYPRFERDLRSLIG